MARVILTSVLAVFFSVLAHCGEVTDARETNPRDSASSSSIRWKENVSTLKDSLNRVSKLRGVQYNWKSKYRKEGETSKTEIGFIAEEVAQVAPEMVEWEVEGKTPSGVKYDRTGALLTEAVKELKVITERLDLRLTAAEQRISAVESAVGQLQGRVSQAEQTLSDHGTSLTKQQRDLCRLENALEQLDEEVASMDQDLQNITPCKCGAGTGGK
jgi:chromosome segregation ATPase